MNVYIAVCLSYGCISHSISTVVRLYESCIIFLNMIDMSSVSLRTVTFIGQYAFACKYLDLFICNYVCMFLLSTVVVVSILAVCMYECMYVCCLT